MFTNLPAVCRATCSLTLMLLPLLIGGPSFAALDNSRFTDDERVGFGFARLTGEKPDFVGWVQNEDFWKHVPINERDKVMNSQLTRLREGMASYDPAVDFIHVAAKATVTWTPAKTKLDGPHDITVVFKPPGVIFSYRLGGQRIDVLPEQLENQVTFELSSEDFTEFAYLAGNGKGLDGVFEFYLQPVKADAATPVIMQGEKTWPMIARTAHMTLWSLDHKTSFWTYNAPWYKDQEHDDLESLYNR